ncbi:MAG: hypothetical protein AABZ41_06020 [Bacteroidota bacterium]
MNLTSIPRVPSTKNATTPTSSRGELPTLILEIVLYGLLTIVTFQALGYYWQDSLKPMPTLLWIFRTIVLYLHEGGHFISGPFGETLMIFGGSFWQIMFPFLLFLFALRDRSRIAPFPLFYAGLSTMDVSYYARDAMFRIQPLIGGMHKNMHDWFRLAIRWELQDDMETIADTLYYAGALCCAGAIGAAFFLTMKSYFRPPVQATGEMSASLHEIMSSQKMTPEDQATLQNPINPITGKEDPWGISSGDDSDSPRAE